MCGEGLALDERALRCPSGHSYDVAKQGYVSLLPGNAHTGTADTPAMVAARAAFLDAGHYRPLADALAGLSTGTVLDAGAGTGHYLGACLRDAPGLALDISKHAMRRAARAHPRIGAVVTDLWRPLPVRDGVADTLLNVFAPRNAPEYRRVLRPTGRLLVVTPRPDHLAELTTPLGLLKVDPHKSTRLAETLHPHFTLQDTTTIRVPLTLTPAEATTLITMTPNAHHLPEAELRARLPTSTPLQATAHVHLTLYTPT